MKITKKTMGAFWWLYYFHTTAVSEKLQQIDKGQAIRGRHTELTGAEAQKRGYGGIWQCWSSIFPPPTTIIECPCFPIGNLECHLLHVSGNETVIKLCTAFRKDYQTFINPQGLETFFFHLPTINWKR